jgi:hypothetical protein
VWAVRGPLNRAVALPDGSISIEAVPEAHTGLFAMKHISLKRLEPHCRTELLKEVETLQALAQEEGNERHILKYFGHKLSGSALKIVSLVLCAPPPPFSVAALPLQKGRRTTC